MDLFTKKNLFTASLFLLFPIITFCIDNNTLNFIPNMNQWDTHVKYKTDLQGGHVYFSNNYFRYVYYDGQDIVTVHETKEKDYTAAYKTPIDCYAYDISFVNSNPNPVIISENKKGFYHNYFLGNDSKKWIGFVPVYASISYQKMYPGIDIKAYSENTSFKYDIIVHPNGQATDIQLKYKGVNPSLLPNGNLQIPIGFNTIEETAPYCYQIIDNKKVEIPSAYQLSPQGILSFVFPKGYNHHVDLIIDPILVFATYSSSTAMTFGFSATYDLTGSLYAGGECFGVGWPSTLGAFQLAYGGGVDAGINKYTPTGNSLVYATYYGGSASDLPNNLVVNANNELAMTGSTTSPNLPVTAGCYDNTLGGTTDAYVVHFNSTGSALIGATYIGGSGVDASNSFTISPNYGDANRGEIYFDTNDDIVVAVSTASTDFPTTAGAYQTVSGGGQDACFFKLNTSCTNLIFSTYFGGTGQDAAFSVAKNSLNQWVLCGGTNSSNLPTTAGTITPSAQGGTDGFVCIFNNNATALVQSTFIGTSSFDHAFKVQVDPMDTIYVCGQTQGATFPVSPGVYNIAGGSIFIQKLSPDLSSMILSTRIGQTSTLIPTAFLKDNCGNVYFSGFQAGAGLALTPNAYQTLQGGFWLCVISGDFTSLVYATYMGASGDHVDGGTSRFDPQGKVYHSVCTASSTQYQSPGCLAPLNLAGSWDVASFKFDFELSGVQASLVISPNDSGCAPFAVNFTNTTIAGLTYLWDFGDGNTSNVSSPTHTYTTAGTYTVALYAFNPNGCISSDTAYTIIKVIPSVDASFTGDIRLDCVDDTVTFNLNTPVQNNTLFSWNFGDGSASSLINPTHVYTNQGIYTITCIANNSFCTDTFKMTINLNHPILANFSTPDSICLGDITNVTSISQPNFLLNHTWDFGNGFSINNGNTMTYNYTYPISGLYTILLTVTDTLGCIDTATQKVFVDNPAFVDFTLSDSIVCVGEPVYFNDTMAPYTVWFEWDFGDGKIAKDIHDPMHSWDIGNSINGYYISLTGHYYKCKPMTIIKNVKVFEHPLINIGNDTMICPGLTGSIILSDINNSNTTSKLWSTGAQTNTITVNTPGRYWLKAFNGDCATVDSIWIKQDCYINIPNSFSPDGDGLNDYFLPRELLSSGLRNFQMNIYNRWGEQIFTTNSIEGRGWDGMYGGKKQDLGVYVYVINAEFINGIKKTFKGNVTLIR